MERRLFRRIVRSVPVTPHVVFTSLFIKKTAIFVKTKLKTYFVSHFIRRRNCTFRKQFILHIIGLVTPVSFLIAVYFQFLWKMYQSCYYLYPRDRACASVLTRA